MQTISYHQIGDAFALPSMPTHYAQLQVLLRDIAPLLALGLCKRSCKGTLNDLCWCSPPMGCFGGVGSYVQSFAAGTQQFWLTLPSTPFGLEMPPEACVLAVLAVLPADGLPPPTSGSVGSGASYVDVVTYPPTWKIYILQAPASCGDLTYDGASDEIYCNYGGGNLPLQLHHWPCPSKTFSLYASKPRRQRTFSSLDQVVHCPPHMLVL